MVQRIDMIPIATNDWYIVLIMFFVHVNMKHHASRTTTSNNQGLTFVCTIPA